MPRTDGVDGSRSRHQSAKAWKRSSNHERREPPAMEITTIGLDLAKNVYQVHAINGAGEVVAPKTIRRAQVLRFLGGSIHVWWASRRAGRATIGRARSASLPTRGV